MINSLLIVVLVALPLAAAVVGSIVGRRQPSDALACAAGAAAVVAFSGLVAAGAVAAGADLSLTVAGRELARLDPVGAFLVPVLALVATTVLSFARRNLEGDDRADRFAVGASVLLAGTMVVLTAARLDVLVAGWLAGSIATVQLCRYRGDFASRVAARRAARSLAAGDVALVAALALLAMSGTAMELDRLGAGSSGLVGLPLAILLVVAALARAGQLPLLRWLPATVSAPTPVSALLHAGAVNAGAVLLVRTAPLVTTERLALWALAAVAGTSVVLGWSAMRARPDVKGALAESTSAQMGFMLLAVAAGAPVAALTHLAGHALYKSARFLGAGSEIAQRRQARRWSPSRLENPTVGVVATGMGAAVVVTAIWWSVTAPLVAPERVLVAVVTAMAVAHAAMFVAAQPSQVRGWLGIRASLGAAGTVLVAWSAHQILDGSVDHAGEFVPLAPMLAAVSAAALGTVVAWRNEHLAARLLAASSPAPRHRRSPDARSTRLSRAHTSGQLVGLEAA